MSKVFDSEWVLVSAGIEVATTDTNQYRLILIGRGIFETFVDDGDGGKTLGEVFLRDEELHSVGFHYQDNDGRPYWPSPNSRLTLGIARRMTVAEWKSHNGID